MSSDPLVGYDPSKGVAIRNTQRYQWPYEAAGIDVHDNFVDIVGLQVKSVHGAAVNGMMTYANVMTVRYCILNGGSDDIDEVVVHIDARCLIRPLVALSTADRHAFAWVISNQGI